MLKSFAGYVTLSNVRVIPTVSGSETNTYFCDAMFNTVDNRVGLMPNVPCLATALLQLGEGVGPSFSDFASDKVWYVLVKVLDVPLPTSDVAIFNRQNGLFHLGDYAFVGFAVELTSDGSPMPSDYFPSVLTKGKFAETSNSLELEAIIKPGRRSCKHDIALLTPNDIAQDVNCSITGCNVRVRGTWKSIQCDSRGFIESYTVVMLGY